MVSSSIYDDSDFAKRVQFFPKMIFRLQRQFLPEDVSKIWIAITQ